jgi:hypothetical protein
MTKPDAEDLRRFLHPHGRYRGQFTPQYVVFNANLQEFAHRVTYICSLETGGKLTSETAYYEIEQLWTKLKQSKE